MGIQTSFIWGDSQIGTLGSLQDNLHQGCPIVPALTFAQAIDHDTSALIMG